MVFSGAIPTGPGYFHQSKSTEMLEKETELIVQILTERTIRDRDTIALREVLEAEIPKGIKTYIRADVVRWLKQGFKETPHYDRLGAAGPTSRQIVSSLVISLAGEYAFERREYLAMVDNAVHFVENYLCRPHWTLEHFIFEQTGQIDAATLHEKLQYIAEYRYLGSILEQYILTKGLEEISVDQFRSLLAKIDNEVVQQHNAHETALLARPIYEFLLLGDVSPDHPIPIKPLLVFYEDKQMTVLKDYIERVCQIRGREDLSLNELSGIITDLYGGPQQKDASLASGPSLADGELHDGTSGSSGETHPEPVSDEPPEETPAPPEMQPAAGRTNLALSLTFAGMHDAPSSSSAHVLPAQPALPELQSIIAGEQRSMFVRKVFKRDEAYYAGVIAALNRFATWQEASAYLQDLYQINGLDPYSSEVIAFTDAIQQRYLTGRVRAGEAK